MKEVAKKNLFFRLLAILMTFCMSFCFVGCFGLDDLDEEDLADMTDEELAEWLDETTPIDMYGTKVLYRPDSYDFDENSRPLERFDISNYYYLQYAWRTLEYLHNIYNVGNSDYFSGGLYAVTDLNLPSEEQLAYTYDSSRYVTTSTAEYSFASIEDGKIKDINKVVVLADTSYSWNWSYHVDADGFNAYVKESVSGGETIKQNTIDVTGSSFIAKINEHYSYDTLKIPYQNAFYGSGDMTNYDGYAQFSKALAYAIYYYALDLEPYKPQISFKESGVEIKINGMSVDDALKKAQELFDKYGKIVGMNNTLMKKVEEWVLDNVIGDNAQKKVETIKTTYTQQKAIQDFKSYPCFKDKDGNVYALTGTGDILSPLCFKNVSIIDESGTLSYMVGEETKYTFKEEIDGKSVFEDEDGNEHILTTEENGSIVFSKQDTDESGETIFIEEPALALTPIYNIETSESVCYDRDYKNTLHKILAKVNTLVSIGGIEGDSEESNIDVDNPYMASEIIEYSGGMFFVNDDSAFPRAKSSNASNLKSIPAREYQSVTIMLKESLSLCTLAVALKYDSNCDGDGESGEVDESGNDYIEITLDLNYYNHEEDKLYTKSSPKLRVYSGSFDFDNEVWESEEPVSGHAGGYVFDGVDWTIGKFNVDIGDGILMTEDVGKNGYSGRPTLVSQLPSKITGHTKLKNWYSIVEDSGTFYSGRLNEKMFSKSSAGAKACDYLEICYKVHRDTNNLNKNYKFYTGISMIVPNPD